MTRFETIFYDAAAPKRALATVGAGENDWVLLLDERFAPADKAAFDAATAAALASCPEKTAALMCRWLPGDVSRHIDPATLEAHWLEGPAIVLNRTFLAVAGGFDFSQRGTYFWDDLALRLRAVGGRLFYTPNACVCGTVTAESAAEYAANAQGKLLFAAKYDGAGGIARANGDFIRTLRHPTPMPGVRKALARAWLAGVPRQVPHMFWRFGSGGVHRQAKALIDGFARKTQTVRRTPSPLAAPLAAPPAKSEGPKISVVMRTHDRPERLRQGLASVANQTWTNYEIVVIEDGAPVSQAVATEEFGHLPLRYHATGTPVGRGKAGNLGLAMAEGEYLNFLDDDDLFYPDHLELLAAQALQNPAADLVLGSAMVLKVDALRETPLTLNNKDLYSMRFDRIDIFTLCQQCQIPIQSAMFKKSLFEACGGLREDLDGNEDWAMWLRFFAKGRRANPQHVDASRETSVFVQDADPTLEARRLEHYRAYNATLFADPDIRFTVSLAEMRGFYDGVLADMAHLHSTGQLDAYLTKNLRRDDGLTEGK